MPLPQRDSCSNLFEKKDTCGIFHLECSDPITRYDLGSQTRVSHGIPGPGRAAGGPAKRYPTAQIVSGFALFPSSTAALRCRYHPLSVRSVVTLSEGTPLPGEGAAFLYGRKIEASRISKVSKFLVLRLALPRCVCNGIPVCFGSESAKTDMVFPCNTCRERDNFLRLRGGLLRGHCVTSTGAHCTRTRRVMLLSLILSCAAIAASDAPAFFSWCTCSAVALTRGRPRVEPFRCSAWCMSQIHVSSHANFLLRFGAGSTMASLVPVG